MALRRGSGLGLARGQVWQKGESVKGTVEMEQGSVPSSGGCLEPQGALGGKPGAQVCTGGQCKPQETELFTAFDLRAHFSHPHPPFSQFQATSATNSNSPAWKFSLFFLAINNSGG